MGKFEGLQGYNMDYLHHTTLCTLFFHLINSAVAYACTMESYYDSVTNGGVIELQGMEMYSLAHSPAPSPPGGTISCHWTIHVPHGKSVFISASHFHIPQSDDACGAASLQVLDGSVTPAVLHYKACGDTFEPVYRNWPVIMIRYTQKTSSRGGNYVKPELRLIWQIVDVPPVIEKKCLPGEFTCELSGRCVKQTSLCNKIPDCVYGDLLDYSDETTKCYNKRSDYRSSAQIYQSQSSKVEEGGAASTLKEVLSRNRFTALTASVIGVILVAISVFVITLFYYLSRTRATTSQSQRRLPRPFLRYRMLIPGRRQKTQKTQNSMLPCSPEIVVEKKAAVTDPEFHREYFARKSSTAEKLSLYSDPPPPFEDSVATEVTSLYGERDNRYLMSYSPAPSTVQSCPVNRLVVTLTPTSKKQLRFAHNQTFS